MSAIPFLPDESDISNLASNLDAQIEAVNTSLTSCSGAGLSASDQTAWNGYYHGWKTGPFALWSYYHAIPATVLNAPWVAAEIVASPQMYSDMLGYQKLLPTWQAKVAAACTNYTVPPAIPTAQPQPDSPWWKQLTDAAKLVGGVAVAGLVGYATFQVVELALPIAASAAAARRRKPEPKRLER